MPPDAPGSAQGGLEELSACGKLEIVDDVDQQQRHIARVGRVTVQVLILCWHRSVGSLRSKKMNKIVRERARFVPLR